MFITPHFHRHTWKNVTQETVIKSIAAHSRNMGSHYHSNIHLMRARLILIRGTASTLHIIRVV